MNVTNASNGSAKWILAYAPAIIWAEISRICAVLPFQRPQGGRMDRPKSISRRRVLAAGTAGLVGAALPVAGQNADQAARPKVPADPTKVQGPLATDVGQRSPFEQPKRVSLNPRRTSSQTPLQDLDGIITPADLHFERHHGGVPAIDPKQYSLLIHGMVDRPLVFTLDDL